MSKSESLIFKIANAHFTHGDLEKALKFTCLLSEDVDNRETFKVKIANAYFDKGDLENALKSTSCLYDWSIKEALIVKIANVYFDKDDLENALKCVKEFRKLLYYDTVNEEALNAKSAHAAKHT